MVRTACLVLLFHALILPAAARRQGDAARGVLTGRVTDSISGRPIAGAQVLAEGRDEALTDADGNYRIELAPGTYSVRVGAVGYDTLIDGGVTVTGRRTTVHDVRLATSISEQVEVRSGVFAESAEMPVGNITLSRAEIRQTPGTGGDPLRVINSLPGVTSASTEFADLIVRGGATDENLTFVENIPVDDFTYLSDKYDQGRGGRLAILPPDVFERLEFSAGGFGVRYGDRLSSALDVKLRSAARQRAQGVLFADSGTAGVTLEVPLGERAGWLFTARRSYIDVAFDVVDIGEFGRPRNFDFINKLDFDLSARHRLSLTALNLFERFTLDREQARRIDRRVDRLETVRSGQRAVVGLTLTSTIGAAVLSQVTAWGSGRHADGTFLRLDRTLQRARDLRDSEFGVKQELTAALTPRLSAAAGGGVTLQQADYSTFERSGFGFSPLEEEFLAPTRGHRLRLPATFSGYGYGQATWRPVPRLALTPGVRVDRYGLTGQTLLSPRASARFNFTPRLAVNLAGGVYRQPPGLFVLALAPENRDLRAQRAAHAVAGVEWLAREDVRVVVEAYRKNYDDLIVRPTRLAPAFFNTGEGHASGVEVYVQKALAGRFAGQVAYSYTRSRRRFDSGGVTFPADTERPHQLTAVGITRPLGFNVAAKYRVASGLPYTPTVPVEFRPGVFLQRIARPADRNSARLPAFANLDVRVERRFNFGRSSFAPYVDFFNVTGRDSNTELDYEFFSPAPLRLREGRTLPIFGARFEF